ncbi:TetR family transcriptional regulator [Mycolicibacterium arenosum]|uniref:TetR family transcriptional regulator n=1 Tax=Mycolicibacterium arenosum TaxID=2952157 RepID=A0ABT1M0H6_9MYCO|nr:TetR family transcriptional regulator [Mycolicibacterium sp. CAU 1645]MCP9272656.1 TetR family transcriptional regulator [Mycolicibacterium sp. CAU 1645]
MQLRRRDVVDKAARLLDDYGIADLTMRRLARELGVSPGALYWHFADKQELLGAVADRILEPAVDGQSDAEWQGRIHAICRTLRNALLSTTDGAELVSATLATGKSTALATVLSRLTDAAAAAGVDADHAGLVARTIIHYVLGFTADEQSRIQWDAAGALPEEQSILNEDPTARFAFGLDLLVTGVAHVPGARRVSR